MEPIDLNSNNNNEKGTNGMASASLILGILSLIPLFYIFVSPVLGILALIFGIISRKKGNETDKKRATAGIICGIIGIILSVIAMILFFAFISLIFDLIATFIKVILDGLNVTQMFEIIKERGIGDFIELYKNGDVGGFVSNIGSGDNSLINNFVSGELGSFLDIIKKYH